MQQKISNHIDDELQRVWSPYRSHTKITTGFYVINAVKRLLSTVTGRDFGGIIEKKTQEMI